MKYVVIIVVVVILVRIDVILRLFDKTATKYQNRTQEITLGDIPASSDIVPLSKDLSLKATPKKNFISMVNDFGNMPDQSVKDRAIEVLRSQPAMFSDKLDAELESSVYSWRNLLIQRNKSAHEFLLEMMKYLKGENLEMVKKFYSFAIDIDMGDFLSVYSKSSDINCMIITYLGDNLPAEEKYNELSARFVALNTFLSVERPEPIKVYGQRCQMVLKLQVDKLNSIVAPTEPAAAPESQIAPAPAPESVPTQETSSPINTGSTP
jgi:hypothetical protein